MASSRLSYVSAQLNSCFWSIRRFFLDCACRLVVIVAQIGGRLNAVTLVFNDRNCRLLGCGAKKASPRGFEFGKHGIPVRTCAQSMRSHLTLAINMPAERAVELLFRLRCREFR